MAGLADAACAIAYVCPMCMLEAPSVALLPSHLRLIHSNDPRFSLLQEPEEIRLGDPVYCPRFAGNKWEFVPTYDTNQYIPLLNNL